MFSNKPLKDKDTADQAQRLQAAAWSAIGAIIFALIGGLKFGVIGLVLGYVVGFALIYYGAIGLAGRIGGAASTVYMSSGSTTPARRQYSLGDALTQQEKFDEAAAEFERCAAVYADDPEPRLRLARLHRDRTKKLEDAAAWFKQTLQLNALDAGTEVMASRELAELFINKLRTPERALPVLARLAERHGNTPGGAWARTEMAAIKDQMRQSRG